MPFGDILRELLEERNLSQKQLAHDLSLAPSTLGNYIRNLREPDYETLKNIAGYFHVSTDYLLDYRSVEISGHQEERLLRLYRSMDSRMQSLYLAQGTLLLQYSAPARSKRKKTDPPEQDSV